MPSWAICWCQMKHLFEQTFSPSGWCIHSIGDWCSPNPWRQKDSSNSQKGKTQKSITWLTLRSWLPHCMPVHPGPWALLLDRWPAHGRRSCLAPHQWFASKESDVQDKSSKKGPRPKKRQYIRKRPKVSFFQIFPRDFRNFYQTHTCLQVPQLLTASAQPRFGASQQLVTNKRQLNLRLESAD